MSQETGASSGEGEDVLKPGTTLLTCEPFVYSGRLPSPAFQICDTCLTIDEKGSLLRCDSCPVVRYCSRTCQEKGWNDGHKYECEGLKLHSQTFASTPQKSVGMARILLRLFVKLQDGNDDFDELEIGGSKVKRRFSDLMSHSEELREDKTRLEGMWRIVKLVKLLLEPKSTIKIPDETKLIEIFGKVNTNAFEMEDGFNNYGIGVYLGSSIFNHSCDPMATRMFAGPTMFVRSLVEIPKSLPISQVTVTYVSQLMPSPQRRKALMKDYYFHCECERCKTSQFDKEMRSVICSNNGCDAKVDTEEMRDPCKACGHVIEEEVVSKVLKTEKFIIQLLDRDNLDLRLIEDSIEKMKSLNFYNSHWLMVQLFREAFYKASTINPHTGKAIDRQKAFDYGIKYHLEIKRYLRPYDKELLRSSFELAWFAFLLRNDKVDALDEAEKYITEAETIAEVLHGKNSPIMQNRIASIQNGIRQVRFLRGMMQLALA